MTVESPDLGRVKAAMAAADNALVGDLTTATESAVGGAWLGGLAARARGLQDTRVLVAGATVSASSSGFVLRAAQSTVPLSGGLVPAYQWPGVEFGARTRRVQIATHSGKGKPYTVTKMINRGLPSRQKTGQVVFKTASETVTEMVRIWVTTIAEGYEAAAAGGAK
ncbi:MAG TPA: hypothetical protein VGM94_02745 [Galbitalea sp.]|jgi:hypothetical protein